MLHKGQFTNQLDYERAVAAKAAGDAIQDARKKEHHDRENANRDWLQQALREVPTTSVFPWLSLRSRDEHPDVKTANDAVLATESRLAAITAGIATAEIELTEAEEAAARGEHNDAVLRSARERIAAFQSDVRIAKAAVRLAKQEQTAALRRITFACAANLKVMHDAELVKFDAALLIAREHSQRLQQLEDKSRQLIECGPYVPRDRRWATHLRRVSWRKEFSRGGFLDYWRKYFGLDR
jgi:hypothetical protein